MLRVGILDYMGKEYYIHISKNGSKIRFLMFDRYTKEQKEQIDITVDEDELKEIKRHGLPIEALYRQRVDNLRDNLVGGVQSDKKGKKIFLIGDTDILNRFMSKYEYALSQRFEDLDGVTISDTPTGKFYKYTKSGTTDFVKYTLVKTAGVYTDVRTDLSFNLNGIMFTSLHEKYVSVHSAPYKTWEWTEDVNFNSSKFRRNIIALSAKTLTQLKQEKDLSWCFNKDGSMKKDYKVVHTMDEVRACVEEIELMRATLKEKHPNQDMPVAIDCETTGLAFNSLPKYTEDGEKNPLKDEIGGMSLTWKKDQGIYIPFLHTKFQNVPREECLTFLRPFLEKWYLETHNGLFDGTVFRDNDIKLNIMDDSMIMLFNINPTVAKGSKGLKENTLKRYGHETLDHDDVFPSKKDVSTFFDLPEDIVEIYACADSDYTHRLCHDLRRELPAIKPYRLDMRVMKYLIEVNYNGNKIDQELLGRLSKSVDEDISKIEELMYKFVGQVGQLTQATKIMKNQVKIGTMKENEIPKLLEELKAEESFRNARFVFVPSEPEILSDILYNRLAYPVVRVSKKSGKPSTDKQALKDLAKEENDVGSEGTWLKEDVLSASIMYGFNNSDSVLISASKFNRMKYPFVLLLQKWRELNKLKTTFFAWFLNGACDGMYYSSFSMTNAETSRIIGRIQTLKGAMKQLVVPYSDDYYLMGVDFSQIEARLMAYLAGEWHLVEELCNPRADYHVVSAASLTGKEPWQITKSERGELKSVNFAVPYGMAEFSLAENLYGRPVTNEKLDKARVLLSQWKSANWEIQALLDSHRKFAKEEREVLFFNPDTRKLEMTKRRFVINKFGRRRYFSEGIYKGSNLDMKTLASIDRMAGNFPIQSYAAEIFKTAFVNINRRLEKEGLTDKVKITALVHDEFLFNIHRSVDKYRMYKIIWEEMVQSIYLPKKTADGKYMKDENGDYIKDKENPVKFFFAGISVGPEWHDIHGNDAHEAPTEFLMEMVRRIDSGEYKYKEYEDGDVTEECFNETKEFMRDLLMKECFKLQPDLKPDNVQFNKIVPAFFDYYLKGKLKIYVPEISREVKPKDDSDDIRARLESLMFSVWGCDELTCYDDTSGVPRTVKAPNVSNVATEDIDIDEDIDMGDMFEELFEEDSDNFDDFDEDDSFDISIPVGQFKKEESDFNILAKRTDVNDERDIWDLVDFGKKINTYSVEEESKIMLRSDTVFINISEASIDTTKSLIEYLASQNNEDGAIMVKLKLNSRVRETGIKVSKIDKEKIYEIMGWSLF